MEYSREYIIEAINEFEGFTIEDSSHITAESCMITFGGAPFLLVFGSEKHGNPRNIGKLNSSFLIKTVFTFDETLKPRINTIDKYRLASKLNEESPALARVYYKEKFDAYLISANYYPFLEQLPDFDSLPEKLVKKMLRFILISLSAMCLEFKQNINDMINEYLNDENYFEDLKVRVTDEE